MGGRIGARMEKFENRNENGLGMAQNQTVRQEEDSMGIDEDGDDMLDSDCPSVKKNPLSKMIEREPEREPDNSGLEGNITYNL